MNFMTGFAGICIVIVLNSAVAQPDRKAPDPIREDLLRRGVNPWREEAYRLPALEHGIDVVMGVATTSIAAYEPLIVNVTLTNRDTAPLRLDVRDDGLPYGTGSVVTVRCGATVRHNQRLGHYETSPAAHDVVLAPGESTTGELLIISGGPPTGVAFPKPGRYTVACACQPDGRFAPVLTNEVRVSVGKLNQAEKSFFAELRALSIWYYGINEDYLIEREGEEIRQVEFGLKLLRRLIRGRTLRLIDPERDPADTKVARLVASLEELLERYPDSSYSGYIARFLGLVYVEALEDEVSLEKSIAWKETGKAPQPDATLVKAKPAYQKALKYLTKAAEDDLWPASTARYHLGILHMMVEDWEKAEACCAALRNDDTAPDAKRRADELESEIRDYQEKVARRTAGANE